MRRYSLLVAAAVAVVVASGGSSRAANLVQNHGFETLESYIGPWPTSYGVWKGDISQGVGAENGVAPIGSGMLKFVNTRWVLSYPNGGTGDLLQFIDMAPLADEIASGSMLVRYSARFNRVADTGAGTVDTSFSVRLFARSGSLGTFFDDDSPKLAFGEATILTDNDVSTWQRAVGVLAIPAGTTHLALQVRATENVVNDVANEFAGHYADEVFVGVVPEPTAAWLMAVGIAALGRRCRRSSV